MVVASGRPGRHQKKQNGTEQSNIQRQKEGNSICQTNEAHRITEAGITHRDKNTRWITETTAPKEGQGRRIRKSTELNVNKNEIIGR